MTQTHVREHTRALPAKSEQWVMTHQALQAEVKRKQAVRAYERTNSIKIKPFVPPKTTYISMELGRRPGLIRGLLFAAVVLVGSALVAGTLILAVHSGVFDPGVRL